MFIILIKFHLKLNKKKIISFSEFQKKTKDILNFESFFLLLFIKNFIFINNYY